MAYDGYRSPPPQFPPPPQQHQQQQPLQQPMPRHHASFASDTNQNVHSAMQQQHQSQQSAVLGMGIGVGSGTDMPPYPDSSNGSNLSAAVFEHPSVEASFAEQGRFYPPSTSSHHQQQQQQQAEGVYTYTPASSTYSQTVGTTAENIPTAAEGIGAGMGTGSAAVPAYSVPNADLVAQITASVLQQLQLREFPTGNGNGNAAANQPSTPLRPNPVPGSNNSGNNNNAYGRAYSHGPSGSTSSLSPPSTSAGQIYTPPSPYKFTDDTVSSPQALQQSYQQTGNTQPFENSRPKASVTSPANNARRPRLPERLPTSAEETTLEKIWGPLFDRGGKGKPTQRLGQFLRGIAVHLIENYPPFNTLVVTPEKLQRYYADTHVPSDPYPWADIFDDRTSSISRLYRDLSAEHHLVQDRQHLDERPDNPGLTPHGFERLATLLIQANPDREYERLQRTVQEMPINNPDDRRERFPKELSRRLFPRAGDVSVKDKLEQAVGVHCHVDVSSLQEAQLLHPPMQSSGRHHRTLSSVDNTPSAPPPPPPMRSPSGPQHRESRESSGGGNASEPKRKVYPMPPSIEDDDSSCSDDDHHPAPVSKTQPTRPIERERKPYSAQPGGGKTYSGGSNSTTPNTANFPTQAPQMTTSSSAQGPGPGPRGAPHRESSWSSTTMAASDSGEYRRAPHYAANDVHFGGLQYHHDPGHGSRGTGGIGNAGSGGDQWSSEEEYYRTETGPGTWQQGYSRLP